jgi:hypothetical protein
MPSHGYAIIIKKKKFVFVINFLGSSLDQEIENL